MLLRQVSRFLRQNEGYLATVNERARKGTYEVARFALVLLCLKLVDVADERFEKLFVSMRAGGV